MGRIRPTLPKRLGYLETKRMALVAEIHRIPVHHVTVNAVERVLIVRRGVRIVRLLILGFFHQLLQIVATRAGFQGGFLRIGFIGAMARFTRNPFSGMAFSTRGGVSRGCGQCQGSQ